MDFAPPSKLFVAAATATATAAATLGGGRKAKKRGGRPKSFLFFGGGGEMFRIRKKVGKFMAIDSQKGQNGQKSYPVGNFYAVSTYHRKRKWGGGARNCILPLLLLVVNGIHYLLMARYDRWANEGEKFFRIDYDIIRIWWKPPSSRVCWAAAAPA